MEHATFSVLRLLAAFISDKKERERDKKLKLFRVTNTLAPLKFCSSSLKGFFLLLFFFGLELIS